MTLEKLKTEISACRICGNFLPHGPNPVFRANEKSRILLVGQAPGTRVHNTRIPWNDPSGDRLRGWLGLSREEFYNEENISIIPMGFCYPGKGKSGDLPPRAECAPAWHGKLLKFLPNLRLTLLIGQYSQKYYLGKRRKENLTETVRNFKEYLPDFFPLPHPSPRNTFWLQKHPWFETEVVPALKERCQEIWEEG